MLLLSAFTMAAAAQQKEKSIVPYGAGIAELTWVNGRAALNLGGYGGILINQKLMLGITGNNIFFKHTVNNRKESFQFNYYGIMSEYRFKPEKRVGLSVGLTGAFGWQENNVMSAKKTGRKDGDFTFVIQPKVGLNVKLVKFLQVQAYSSYRFTGNTHSQYYSSSNHNGVSGGVSLVFGSF